MNMLASDLTFVELANALAATLSLTFQEAWSVSLPSTPDAQEAWLHGKLRQAAALHVTPGAIEAWFDGTRQRCAVERRSELEEGGRWAVRAVHRQHALYARNLELTKRVGELAEQLVVLLRSELPGLSARMHRLSSASHAASGYAHVYAGDPPRVVAEISAEQGELSLRAGSADNPAYYACRADAGVDRAQLIDAIRAETG